jgi:hypothetical protein
MERYNKIQKLLKAIFKVVLIVLVVPTQNIFSQEGDETEQETVEKIRPIVSLESHKNKDNSRTLIGVFKYRDPETRKFAEVKDVPLNFYVGVDSLISLGSFNTDIEGKAYCKIDLKVKLPKNEEGYITFSVEFEGNQSFKSRGSEAEVIDLDLGLSLEVVDSVKTITVKAEKILANDERVPLNEVEIPIYVKRMFSDLKIGDVYLEEGEGTFEFPENIPGDTLGMVQILAKLIDDEDYAYVEKSEDIDWGVVTSHHEIYHPRSLWTQVAPVWMIVTLTIMLAGVWGHYIFVIIQLIRLKRRKQEGGEVVEPAQ